MRRPVLNIAGRACHHATIGPVLCLQGAMNSSAEIAAALARIPLFAGRPLAEPAGRAAGQPHQPQLQAEPRRRELCAAHRRRWHGALHRPRRRGAQCAAGGIDRHRAGTALPRPAERPDADALHRRRGDACGPPNCGSRRCCGTRPVCCSGCTAAGSPSLAAWSCSPSSTSTSRWRRRRDGPPGWT